MLLLLLLTHGSGWQSGTLWSMTLLGKEVVVML
jgi:hypothetical protein